METVNMLCSGDIYQLTYEYIKTIFNNNSRAARKRGRSNQGLLNSSPSTSNIKLEIGSMLEDYTSDMLQTFSLQMDTMQIERNQEKEKSPLAIFFPRCTKRHPINQCPLNVIEVCYVCEENHETGKCTSLLGLEDVYQGEESSLDQFWFINKRMPQGPRPYQQGMQGAHYYYYNPNQTTPLQPIDMVNFRCAEKEN